MRRVCFGRNLFIQRKSCIFIALDNNKKSRSEGACHRNGLFHSCACGRVAGVVWLLGSGGRLGFVAAVVAAHAPGVRCFSRYVSGDGA